MINKYEKVNRSIVCRMISFVLFKLMLYVPVKNFTVTLRRQGCTITKQIRGSSVLINDTT